MSQLQDAVIIYIFCESNPDGKLQEKHTLCVACPNDRLISVNVSYVECHYVRSTSQHTPEDKSPSVHIQFVRRFS